MKDSPTHPPIIFSVRDPEQFSRVPIRPQREVVQNECLYLEGNTLILPATYAPMERLWNFEARKTFKPYQKEQLEALLQSIRAGVRIEVPRILREYQEEFEKKFGPVCGNCLGYQDRVTQIVIDPKFPRNGREVIYGIGFLD